MLKTERHEKETGRTRDWYVDDWYLMSAGWWSHLHRLSGRCTVSLTCSYLVVYSNMEHVYCLNDLPTGWWRVVGLFIALCLGVRFIFHGAGLDATPRRQYVICCELQWHAVTFLIPRRVNGLLTRPANSAPSGTRGWYTAVLSERSALLSHLS